MDSKLKVNVILLASSYILKKRKRRMWMRKIFAERKTKGDYYNLLQEMRLHDSEKYYNYLRMSGNSFKKLISIVAPSLTKLHYTREPISAGERLAMTLRYLASGDSMVSISYEFRVGTSTVSGIIRETCNVLWDNLNEDVLLNPSEESWKCISEDFLKKWQVPNCVGAIDGKHIVIEAPPKSGSTYFNYKGHHSIVLLALCDANYKFTIVDIGAEGRHSDGGIFKQSSMGKLILEGNINFPPPSPIEYGGDPINHFIVADEAFPLTPHIMRPYPGHFLPNHQRVFNYRLSRARRVVENSFGIFAAKWRIFRKPIIASLETVVNVVKATVCLHNFVLGEESVNAKELHYQTALLDKEKSDGTVIEGDWRKNITANNLCPMLRVSSNMYTKNAQIMRDQIAAHFMFDGAVSFQWNK